MIGRVDSRFATAQQCIHPGEQLGEGEGLDEIIVRSGLQALDPIADGGERGQDKNGGVDLRGPKRPEYGNAVEDRQHPVENDEVEAAVGGPEQAVLTVRRQLDAMTFLAQALGEIAGRFAVVFNEKDFTAHRISGSCSYFQSRMRANDGSARREDGESWKPR